MSLGRIECSDLVAKASQLSPKPVLATEGKKSSLISPKERNFPSGKNRIWSEYVDLASPYSCLKGGCLYYPLPLWPWMWSCIWQCRNIEEVNSPPRSVYWSRGISINRLFPSITQRRSIIPATGCMQPSCRLWEFSLVLRKGVIHGIIKNRNIIIASTKSPLKPLESISSRVTRQRGYLIKTVARSPIKVLEAGEG